MGALTVVHSASPVPDRDAAARMAAAAGHRGGCTETLVHGRTVLAVTHDPAYPTGAVAGDGERATAVAGSLDNQAELAADLRRAGHRVCGEDPASTLLSAVAAWGPSAVGRLRGSFTAAVTDGREVAVARDQFGHRSLHYRSDPRGFFGATEGKQVAAGAGIRREPDLEQVTKIFYEKVTDRTALKGVRRLPRASMAVAGPDGGVDVRRYWDPSSLVETAHLAPDDAADRAIELLDRAVARCLSGSDLVLLSGGLDSPAVAAFAAPHHLRLSGRPLPALSAVFPGHPTVDERPYIADVVDRLGLEWHTFEPQAAALDDVHHWADLVDGPVCTVSLPQAAESYRIARELGARNVLTGELAEFSFGIHRFLVEHLLTHGRFAAAFRHLKQRRERGMAWWQVVRTLLDPLVPAPVAAANARLRRRDTRVVPPWVDAARIGGLGLRPDLAMRPSRRWAELQLLPFRGDALTYEADEICAAACGVASRRPLGDVDLWEFLLSLPAELKFPNASAKPLLRQVVRDMLPASVVDRRDKTFFNEYSLATADYEGLRRLVFSTSERLPGVDYGILDRRLAAGDMPVLELRWARDLARTHAFLGLFEHGGRS